MRHSITRYSLILLLLLIALLPTSPTLAQDDSPPYIVCGAEDYMIQRYYILQIGNEHFEAINDETSNSDAIRLLARYIVANWDARDQLYAIDVDELPECVQELHKLTIERHNLSNEFFMLQIMSSALFGDSEFSTEAGRKDVRRELIDEEIVDLLIELGWLTADLEYTNEPPPPASE